MFRTALVILAFVVGVLAATAQSAMKVPDAQDWGTMRLPKQQFVEAELPIENVAKSGILKILEVKPGCGCTKTDPDKWELKPGEVAKVKIKLNLTPSQSGPIVKTVTIKGLLGSDTIVKVVMLKVNLERVLLIGPSTFVSFNDAAVGAESTVPMTMENPSNTSIKISKVIIDGMIKADLPDGTVLGPREKRELIVRCTPDKPGQISGSIRFTVSGNGDDDEFIVQAYGNVLKVAGK
ncbi:MAG: DUF1573 domain-containing protein [Ignavibacteria bacterium]|nr:DUF1573 domain-containing protein [Ignavibacteria bacterium]MBP7092601.1 DUF1573 domain-containing protein [Candidatus Kapabacteria bacterium]MBK6417888.1 DUF1573 domain-containing protein [Ignavibacteria bacterium]MBK6760916.1 DUF1573 domain-containing protein [Ignavibacteria bacterium]MBK7185474.1 DUF1573 domain-containing protein [Ignavibacteria bacterium]